MTSYITNDVSIFKNFNLSDFLTFSYYKETYDVSISQMKKLFSKNPALLGLRILTGKKHPKIKLQRLRKIRIWTSGLLVHQIKSF